MQRTPVNPWPWSRKLGYDQGQVTQGQTRQLSIAGQTAVDAQGNPQAPGDMRAQFALALDNLQAVVAAAGMGLADLTQITIYTTDVDATLNSMDIYGMRMGPLGAAPPMTLIGVSRLAIPPLMIEIAASAAA
jgi:enamine deaminase RidA (YjgF/YER057c/UK114 family)